jgi:hypothetical protein
VSKANGTYQNACVMQCIAQHVYAIWSMSFGYAFIYLIC